MLPTVHLDWNAQPVTFSVLVCVLMTLPHGAMVRSVICGISWFQNFCENFIQVTLLLSLKSNTPASNLGYLAPPPGQFFMGAKLFIGTPWMGNEGVLKKNLVWAM